jgi:hypothetical protein
MPKRFTATEKYDDPWFRKMPILGKCFWEYLCLRCDNAGVWKVDFDLASFHLGQEIDKDNVLCLINAGKERVSILNGGAYWLIKDFVCFQWGPLNPDTCKPHKGVLKVINSHENKGYPKGIYTLKEKDKEKDKEIVGGVGEERLPFKKFVQKIEKEYREGKYTIEEKDDLLKGYK